MNISKLFQVSIFIFTASLASCGKSPTKSDGIGALKINLNKDSTSVELAPLPEQLAELDKELSMDSLWYNFFAVYAEPENPEMRDFQEPIHGVYKITNKVLVFRPEVGFGPGRYFARCYTPGVLEEPQDYITNDGGEERFLELRFEIK